MFRFWAKASPKYTNSILRHITNKPETYGQDSVLSKNLTNLIKIDAKNLEFMINDNTLIETEKNIILDIDNPYFDPIKFSTLSASPNFSFNFLSEIFEKVSQTKGKDSKSSQKLIFTNFFRLINIYYPKSLLISVNLCSGRIGSEWLQREMGIGEGIISKLISTVSGKPKKEIKSLESKICDLSLVSFELHKNPSQYLSIVSVHNILDSLSLIHGLNSSNKKEAILLQLFKNSSGLESKYLIRLLQKSLRIGASELTVIDSLATAIERTPPNQDFPHKSYESSEKLKKILDNVVKICPDFQVIVNELSKIGSNLDFSGLINNCKSRPGFPVQSMSAQPIGDLKELISRFDNKKVTCEYKYDGIRGQIHLNTNGQVLVYSRGHENITGSYPEILDFIRNSQKSHVKNFIVDCEIVPIDVKNNTLQPFSQIQSRKKKYAENEEAKVSVCFFLFDLLFVNDRSLVDLSLRERRNALFESFKEVNGKVEFVQFRDLESFDEVENVLADAVNRGCEGLMIKILDENSEYEPGTRSFNWLKLKKDYLSNNFASKLLPDSLDLVPIGAFLGSGRRKGLFGSYLLACYDKKNCEFQTVCKIGTGFSDQFLVEQTKIFKNLQIDEPLENYRWKVKPDVWFKPQVVWEVQSADLSISPTHTSAWNKIIKGKGISMRFPRFVRERPDKSINNLTTSEEIFSYYQNQTLIPKLSS